MDSNGGARSIVVGLRAGDAGALRDAYEQHKSDVLAVAAAVLGRGSGPEAAWDVLHDVFVALARTARGLAHDTNLRAYLARAAANRAKDVLRRTRNQPAPLDDNQDVSEPDHQDVFALLADRERDAELWQAVLELPEEQRGVVALHLWGGLTLHEVADATGVSENTAQSRYRYAIDKLKRHFRQGVAS